MESTVALGWSLLQLFHRSHITWHKPYYLLDFRHMTVFHKFVRYKDIILYRTLAGIKSEARQNYLGYVWFLAEPILSTAVLYFAWSQINGSKGFEAVLTILIGMVAWGWFEGSVMNGATAIKAKFHVLSQFDLPKYIFPVVTILVNSWKSMFVFGIILVMALVNGHASIHLVWLPVIVFVQFFLIVGLTLLISIGVTLLNDLNTVMATVFRLLFFVSGLFFTSATVREVSPEVYSLFCWNPIAVLIDAYRAVMQRGESPDLFLLCRAAAIAFAFFVVGLLVNAYYDKKILKLTNV